MSDITSWKMWTHRCPEEGCAMEVGAGEPCNWCGATEQSEMLRQCAASGQMSAAQIAQHTEAGELS